MWKRRDENSSTTGVIDDLIETYVTWREECGRVESSYGRWRIARPAERTLAFAAYVAALDGEDRAAAAYCRLASAAADLVP